MSDDSNSSKPKLICEPWDGTQGAAFTRHFAPNFKGALHGIQDRFATLYDHLNQEDPGTPNNPHPGAIGSEARLESERLYRLRSRKLFSLIRQHVNDETVRQDIDDNANNEGVAAWVIVNRYGALPRTGLTEIDEDAAWTSLRLSDVGIDERTIVNIVAHMSRLNRERDAARQYNDEARRKKLLSLITFPAHLAAKAQEELQRPSYKLNNAPNLQLTVNAFDELWRHAMRNGLIKRQAAPQRARGGNRVDAMHVGADEDGGDGGGGDAPSDSEHEDDGDVDTAYYFKPKGVPASLKGERLCDNCLGWGHEAAKCASATRPRRPGDCIDGVRYLKLSKRRPVDRRDVDRREGKRDAKPLPRKQQWGKEKHFKRYRLTDRNTKKVYQIDADDDGNIYSANADLTCDHESIVDDAPAAALCDEPGGDDDNETFGIIPPTLHAMWESDEEHDGDEEPGTMNATRDAKVAAVLQEAYARQATPLTAALLSLLSLPFLIATHLIKRAARTVIPFIPGRALLVLVSLLHSVIAQPAPASGLTCMSAAAVGMRDKVRCDTALIDSGSTRTASGNKRLFPPDKITTHNPRMRVRVANGVYLHVAFVGTLVLTLPAHDVRDKLGRRPAQPLTLELHDALYVPDLCATLLSTKGMFREQHIRTYLNDELCLVLPAGTYIRIRETPSNYVLQLQRADAAAFAASAERAGGWAHADLDLVHARLAHFSVERINASAGHVHGIDKLPAGAKHSCRACTVGGASKPTTKTPTTRRFEYYGDCIASDLCEMPLSTPFGFRYILTFYDLATKFLEVYYLRTATGKEVRAAFEQFLVENKRYLRGKAITWLTDNGSEFFERKLDAFLRELEIRHKATVPYNPQTNPAERANKLILRPLRITLAAANVSEQLWPWATNQIVYIHNALVTRSATAIAHLTPYELKTGTKPSVEKIRVMFCEANAYLRGEEQEMSKLAPRRSKGVHLGIDARRGGYFVYLLEINRLTTVRFGDVEFDERSFPEVRGITGTYISYTTRYALPSLEQQIEAATQQQPTILTQRDDGERVAAGAAGAEEIQGQHRSDARHQPDANDGPPSARTRSSGHRPQATGHACIVAAGDEPEDYIALASVANAELTLYLSKDSIISDVLPEPKSFKDIAGRPDELEWRQACLEEYQGKLENDTYELVRKPKGARVCKTKWVFKNKLNDGTLERRKARWVLCGYSQRPGEDFDRTFTATARASSVRIFFSMVAFFDLKLCAGDVTRAFTHVELTDAVIYCEQMDGFEQYDPETGEKLVCRLRKALEGGRQSGHLWQKRLTEFLKKYGFTQLPSEPCLFTYRSDAGVLIILVWIDDLAIGYTLETTLEEFILEYSKAFKGSFKHDPTQFLGMAVTRDRAARTITLSQKTYIERLADRFLVAPSLRKPVTVPAWYTDAAARISTYSNLGVAKGDEDSAKTKGKPYLELVASLLYAHTMTRPDVGYYVGTLCRYMHNPSTDCYARAEELLSYLYTTKCECIRLGGLEIETPIFETIRDAGSKAVTTEELSNRVQGNFGLLTYSDSSWKVDHTYIAHVSFFMNGPIDWSTRLLKVSASSCQAETAAACVAAKRNRYIRALTSALLGAVDHQLEGGGTLLLMDNSAAVTQAENLSAGKKSEHYKRWEYMLREAQTDGEVKSMFIRTTQQTADILTKVLDKTTFLKHARTLLKGKV